jgi:hypothetical protein
MLMDEERLRFKRLFSSISRIYVHNTVIMKNAFVFRDVTQYVRVEECQCFEGKCYLHFWGKEGRKYPMYSKDRSIIYIIHSLKYQSTQRHTSEYTASHIRVHSVTHQSTERYTSKYRASHVRVHNVTSQKTVLITVTAMKTSNITY